jgi:type I restriction enzyme S subunit
LPEPSTVDTHVTIVRPASSAVEPQYLAQELMSRESEVEMLGEGSTGQTELGRKRLGAISVCLPGRTEQRSFVQFATPLLREATVLERECVVLTEMRNLLVPRLMSGQLRVRDTPDPAQVLKSAMETATVTS